MKKIIVLSSLVAVAALLCGCLGPGQNSSLAQWQSALGNDHSTLDITLATPWGTETVHRSNPWPSNTEIVVVTNVVFVPQPPK